MSSRVLRYIIGFYAFRIRFELLSPSLPSGYHIKVQNCIGFWEVPIYDVPLNGTRCGAEVGKMSDTEEVRITEHEPALKAMLRREIDLGMSDARDPANAGLAELVLLTTTIYSPWYT